MTRSAREVKLATAQKIAQVLLQLPRGSRSDGQGLRGVGEPSLTDILQDPMFHHLHASDGVQQEYLLELILVVRIKLQQ